LAVLFNVLCIFSLMLIYNEGNEDKINYASMMIEVEKIKNKKANILAVSFYHSLATCIVIKFKSCNLSPYTVAL